MGIASRSLRLGGAAITTMLVISACSGTSPSPIASAGASAGASAAPAGSDAAAAKVPFTIASTSFGLSSVPLLAALDDMRADGYSIEYPALASPDLVAEGMVRNDFNIGVLGAAPAAVAIQQGAPITNVMSQYANPWFMYAATDIAECADLAGRRLAIHSQQSTSAAFGFNWIDQECPGTEPEVLTIAGSENRYAAMIAGEVDASAVEIADAVALEEEAGDRFHQLVSFAETLPDILTTTYAVNTEFAEANPAVVSDLLAAVLEQHKQIDADPAYFPALVDKYKSYIGGSIHPKAIELQGDLYQTDGGFNEETVQGTLDFLTGATVIEPGLEVDAMADFSYLETALEQAGN